MNIRVTHRKQLSITLMWIVDRRQPCNPNFEQTRPKASALQRGDRSAGTASSITTAHSSTPYFGSEMQTKGKTEEEIQTHKEKARAESKRGK